MKILKEDPLVFWYRLAKGLAIVGILFWLSETAYFIWLEGWHWSATNPEEIFCDRVVSAIFSGILFCLLVCLTYLIEDELDRRVELDAIFNRMEDEAIAKDGKLAGLQNEDFENLPAVKAVRDFGNSLQALSERMILSEDFEKGPWIIRRRVHVGEGNYMYQYLLDVDNGENADLDMYRFTYDPYDAKEFSDWQTASDMADALRVAHRFGKITIQQLIKPKNPKPCQP